MASVLKLFAAAVVVVAVVAEVSAQTHHVVGGDEGWGPDLDVKSWLSGRTFSVGDKIWFKHSGTGGGIVVELESPEDFESCNLKNPIRMYTDSNSHIVLEKEGVRYFTSADLERCKNGLKLPIPVQPASDSDHPHGPFTPPDEHTPVDPYPPIKPTPPVRPPPTPTPPSAGARLDVMTIGLWVGLVLCYMSNI